MEEFPVFPEALGPRSALAPTIEMLLYGEKNWFWLLQHPLTYLESTVDPAGYPGVKLALLAALSQLTVWSAACWCHLTALCLWLSDCILYPDVSYR